MKQTIGLSQFRDAFRACDRQDQFSYEALGLLFEYFEEYEAETGEEIKLDVIGICCEYVEMSCEDVADNYRIDLSDCEDDEEREEEVRSYLIKNTSLVGDTSEGFVFAQF